MPALSFHLRSCASPFATKNTHRDTLTINPCPSLSPTHLLLGTSFGEHWYKGGLGNIVQVKTSAKQNEDLSYWLPLNQGFFPLPSMIESVSPPPLLMFFRLPSICQCFFSEKRVNQKNSLNKLVGRASLRKVVFGLFCFFHMASLRRKGSFTAACHGIWYRARGTGGPGRAGRSRTKANLLSCSLGRTFMVHGQKSDAGMLAQLILIRYSRRAAGSRTTDLRLNSFGSQHFAWTFLALDSRRPKDSKQIPDAVWKHAAHTVYRSFPNKTTTKKLISRFISNLAQVPQKLSAVLGYGLC